KEVFATIWSEYKLQLLISIAITIISAYGLNRILHLKTSHEIASSKYKPLLIAPILIILCVMMVRSTFDHRPVNPSTVAFTSDPLINMLPLSSAYSVLYAINETRNEDTGKYPYGEMPYEQALNVVKNNMGISDALFLYSKIPTLHKQIAFVKRDKPLNLVIILEESLGADYVGALGGRDITPQLDKLSKQGIWFENMYATGTRSVRGIEAVITGFPPTPSRSVVKLSKSQTDFFTIAKLLSKHNYDTSFIYGGESHFDNMKRFFVNNGFNKIVDENSYINPLFYGSWGVSDEDLFNKAHNEFLSQPRDKPFFSLVFTSSNHPPFDYPEGRITDVGKVKNTVKNAVKYTDYALGEFIDKAKSSHYWKNTLFLIIADHSDKVYGSEPVPIRHYQIPALILGADIKPSVVTTVASQIDMLPTLLSLMGVDSIHPAIGRDLSEAILSKNNDDPGRAIMQFGGSQAYMEGNHVAILQKNKTISEFTYINKNLISKENIDTNFINTARAHATWSINAYRKSEYRLNSIKNKYASINNKINTHKDTQ
ncbi:MAG: LTA synthase family protein, partial [Pseudomonadota bacterium]